MAVHARPGFPDALGRILSTRFQRRVWHVSRVDIPWGLRYDAAMVRETTCARPGVTMPRREGITAEIAREERRLPELQTQLGECSSRLTALRGELAKQSRLRQRRFRHVQSHLVWQHR